MTADLFENDRISASRDAARAALRVIVGRLSNKVAAAVSGLAESHLSKALSDQPGDRYLRDEHVDAILRLATDAERAAYWTARLAGYGHAPTPVRPRTAAERLAHLEELVIRRFGEAGAQLVDDERGHA